MYIEKFKIAENVYTTCVMRRLMPDDDEQMRNVSNMYEIEFF